MKLRKFVLTLPCQCLYLCNLLIFTVANLTLCIVAEHPTMVNNVLLLARTCSHAYKLSFLCNLGFVLVVNLCFFSKAKKHKIAKHLSQNCKKCQKI